MSLISLSSGFLHSRRFPLLAVGMTLLLLSASRAQNITCKCDEDKWSVRFSADTVRNAYLLKSCAFIHNAELDSARYYLLEALKLNDDVYFSSQLEKIEMCIYDKKQSASATSETAEPVAQPEEKVTAPSGNDGSTDPVLEPVTVSPAAPVAEPETMPAKEQPKQEIPEPEPTAAATASVSTTTESTEPADNVREFSESDLREFQEKGRAKVLELENFIKNIASKQTSNADAYNSINNALQLFDNENHFVQVSSVNRQEKPKYPVRRYLEKLRALNYDQIDITWAEFQYAPKFRKAPDGNYYGYIKFRQRFTATKDGEVVYDDITDKVIGVILKPYSRNIEGAASELLEVFLGDISVVQTYRQ